MVIVFDDWASDPRAVYQRVLAFLGVDDDGLTDFSSKRESAGFRSTFLQSIVMNPPRWLLRVVELSDTKRLEKLKALRKRIKHFNKTAKPRPRLSEEMRAVVRAHFADDVELLSSLLGRDLRHWR
jgi:hypothetical protein